jgi:hypothetical protein
MSVAEQERQWLGIVDGNIGVLSDAQSVEFPSELDIEESIPDKWMRAQIYRKDQPWRRSLVTDRDPCL